jgi:DNA-binding NarL/FixJ family response regulator
VTTVVLVDDQGLVRAGFRALLDSEDETEVVGQAADGETGLQLVRRLRPDVVLMDIRMPVLDGLAATARITSDPEQGGTRVIVLTTFELDEYVFGALRAGASGFCSRTSSRSICWRRCVSSPAVRRCWRRG